MSSSEPGGGADRGLHLAVVLLSGGLAAALCVAVGASTVVAIAAGIGGAFIVRLLLVFRSSPSPELRRPSATSSDRTAPVPVWEAEMLARQGDYDEAIAAYQRLLVEHPDHVELIAAIAELRFTRKGEYGVAARDWAEALRLLPSISEGHRRVLQDQGLPNYWQVRLDDCRRKLGREGPEAPASVELPTSKGRF